MSEQPIAGPLAALRLKTWEMRIRMFFLCLADGTRGTAAALQWYQDDKRERDSGDRARLRDDLPQRHGEARARDDELLMKAPAASPRPPPANTQRSKKVCKGDGGEYDRRHYHDRGSDRECDAGGRGRGRDNGRGGRGAGGRSRGGAGGAEGTPLLKGAPAGGAAVGGRLSFSRSWWRGVGRYGGRDATPRGGDRGVAAGLVLGERALARGWSGGEGPSRDIAL